MYTRYLRNLRRALALALALALSAGCGPSVPPLGNVSASPQEVATAVLGAIERRDVATLRALALDDREFRDHIWPELPAARPERNLPFAYVWGDLHQKSEAALAATVAEHGGRHYELIRAASLGGTTQYHTYLVHRDTALAVKDSAGGRLQLRLFGSMVEKEGRFKIFSYVVD